jgi:hypothetical protein
MNRTIVPLVTFGVLAWAWSPGAAQEPIKPPEKLEGEKLPVTEKLEAPPLLPPGCEHEHPGVRILWLERQVPIQVLTPREVIGLQKRPALVVDFRKEKRLVTEIILKPQEVVRQIPFTTMKPHTEVCPETGHCTTTYEPCTELRTVKETIFTPIPEQRWVEVDVPFVKEVLEDVPQKTFLLEYRTELQRCPGAIAAPTTVLPERWFAAPQGCVHPEHPPLPPASGEARPPEVLPPPNPQP